MVAVIGRGYPIPGTGGAGRCEGKYTDGCAEQVCV